MGRPVSAVQTEWGRNKALLKESAKKKIVDLGLVNSDGHGRPVPVDVELEVMRYMIGEQINTVKANPELLIWERWNHSKVFYDSRTWLNQHNWDTSIYGSGENSPRRKRFYSKIRRVCETFYGKKHHEVGIFPNDRAAMTFGGTGYAANYHNLRHICTK